MTDNKGRIFGYVRVSSKDQNEGRQVVALKHYVPDEKNIVIEKASGKDFNREKYQALKQFTTTGDTIYIKSLDRLGRNKNAIKKELQDFKDKGVMIRVLNIPTTLVQFGENNSIADLVLNIMIEVMGYVAEQERLNIRQRQKEGIALAKAVGKHIGRPQLHRPDNWEQVYRQWRHKEITARKAMELLQLKRQTFYNMVKQYEEEEREV